MTSRSCLKSMENIAKTFVCLKVGTKANHAFLQCGRYTCETHWFGRLKRKSIIISKSKEMGDLTMALFARFWVNGDQKELLSLLA